MKTVVAQSMPRLYVHDVKGFLWAAAGAILLIDLPLMFGGEHKASAMIAAGATVIGVALFIWAYCKYGAARQKAIMTVNVGKQEALELCLAALGQLEDCRITHLNQADGSIQATARCERVSHDISFQINNVLGETWEIAIGCRPSDSWTLVDLSGTNRRIVYDLRYFLHGFQDWDYTCDSEIANAPFTANRCKRRAKMELTLTLAVICAFLFLSIPAVGKYAAFRMGMLMYDCGNYNLAKSLMTIAAGLDLTSQQAKLISAKCELASGDRLVGMRGLAANISMASDSLAQSLIIRGNIYFRSRQFAAASKDYDRAAQTAFDGTVRAYAIKRRDLAIRHQSFPAYGIRL